MLSPAPRDAATNVPLAARLEQAVTVLRHQLEQHLAQESRLQGTVDRVHRGWSAQSEQISRQINLLEGQLSAWMTAWEIPPQLSVVRD